MIEVKRKKRAPYNKFKAFLKIRNNGLSELAELLNCSISNISLKNNGYSDYSNTEINKICEYYGIEKSSDMFDTPKLTPIQDYWVKIFENKAAIKPACFQGRSDRYTAISCPGDQDHLNVCLTCDLYVTNCKGEN